MCVLIFAEIKISVISWAEIFTDFIWTEPKVEKSQKSRNIYNPFCTRHFKKLPFVWKVPPPSPLLFTLKTTHCVYASNLTLTQCANFTPNKFLFLISFSHALYQTRDFWNPFCTENVITPWPSLFSDLDCPWMWMRDRKLRRKNFSSVM